MIWINWYIKTEYIKTEKKAYIMRYIFGESNQRQRIFTLIIASWFKLFVTVFLGLSWTEDAGCE